MQIDSNTDGLVDFTEFVAATLHVHQMEEHDSEKWQERSQAAFEKFDIDKDGFITPEELRLVSVIILDQKLPSEFFRTGVHSSFLINFENYPGWSDQNFDTSGLVHCSL